MRPTRRALLSGTAGSLATGLLAGCLDAPADREESMGGDGPVRVVASFFTLAEFARAVGGDAVAVETPVPVGAHGHGWEPPGDLLPEILEADAFVFLDVTGFQPWAEAAAATIRDDHDGDVALIDARAGIDLLPYADDACGDDRPRDLDVAAVELSDPDTGGRVADYHPDHWHGEPVTVPREESRSLAVALEDGDGEAIPIGDGGYDLGVRSVGNAVTTTVEVDRVAIEAREAGTGAVVVQVVRDGTVAWESPAVDVAVPDAEGELPDALDAGHEHDHEHDQEHDHEHDHDHDHEHGEYDAKFFSDPLLAREAVDAIRDALTALDPANEERYATNAADYRAELEALHDRFEARLADRRHDAVVLAGHDSFRYFGERYGIDIHTPVGLSPHDSPTEEDVAAAVEFLEERGIEYVLWDYFDGDDLAEAIADEASTVRETLVVSPGESVTEAWIEDGHGDYLSQWRELTLPAFERALGVE